MRYINLYYIALHSFLFMLRTNKQTYKQTDRQTKGTKRPPTPTVGVDNIVLLKRSAFDGRYHRNLHEDVLRAVTTRFTDILSVNLRSAQGSCIQGENFSAGSRSRLNSDLSFIPLCYTTFVKVFDTEEGRDRLKPGFHYPS